MSQARFTTSDPRHSSMRMWVGALLIAMVFTSALLAPAIAPSKTLLWPVPVNLDAINLEPFSSGHLLGTDLLGRDILAEALWGARMSLVIGIVVAVVAVTFGGVWGALSAFSGGPIDTLMMRAVDGLLAIPNIVLLLTINTLLTANPFLHSFPEWFLRCLKVTSFSSGYLPLFTVIVVISATTWLEAARISRSKIQSILLDEYIYSARALGIGVTRMLFRHLLPNAAPVLLVEATLLVSDAILMEAGLSFLGLGLGPSTPSWGSMLTSAQSSLIEGNWWAVIVPGVLITTTVVGVNLVGEGILESQGGKRQAR
ncbi:MAG: ABC transporter permease [Candidatus Melainabacteria bacterium]|nr:ABC transporter permease [Candidatus Melainabacteria bacterium]